jgi:hypothetical protein
MTTWTWQQIVDALSRQGADATARVDAHHVEHPHDGGLTATFGLPRGQRATFRASLSDGGILFVDDFATFYEARIDRVAPAIQKAQPAPPNVNALGPALGLSALGALLGLALGQNERSAMTGALLGGAVGLGAVAINEADRSPESSKMALGLAQGLAKIAVSSMSSPPPRALPALRARAASTSPARATTGGRRRRAKSSG